MCSSMFCSYVVSCNPLLLRPACDLKPGWKSCLCNTLSIALCARMRVIYFQYHGNITTCLRVGYCDWSFNLHALQFYCLFLLQWRHWEIKLYTYFVTYFNTSKFLAITKILSTQNSLMCLLNTLQDFKKQNVLGAPYTFSESKSAQALYTCL